jgi:hypothetical protein
VHLTDLQRHVEEATLRLTRLEQGRQHGETLMMQLNHYCKDVLVSKQAHSEAEDAFNRRLNDERHQWAQDMLEFKRYAKSEADLVREAFSNRLNEVEAQLGVAVCR